MEIRELKNTEINNKNPMDGLYILLDRAEERTNELENKTKNI